MAAGYEVIAIDAFADEETKQLAQQTIQVKLKDGCFDTDDFLNKIQSVACESCLGLIYGSGFEGNIELLSLLAEGHLTKQLPIIGNLPQTVAQIKNAASFFKVLDDLNIIHPNVSFTQLDDASGWLLKHDDGSGGLHVQAATAHASLGRGEYFQREVVSALSVTATPISLLFLANGLSAEVVGFNRQFLAATKKWPYRFGGIVSHYPITEYVQKILLEFANKLTKHYGLRGLNSLDAMLEGDAEGGRVSVLEINPRLSASVGLYTFESAHLMAMHINACAQASKNESSLSHDRYSNSEPNHSELNDSHQASETVQMPVSNKLNLSLNLIKAQGIFYAPFDCYIKPNMHWPAWIVDIPQANTWVKKDAPVCTVTASMISAELAYQQLITRLASVARKFCP